MSRRPYKTPQWEPVILRMFAAGETYREICRTTGLSEDAIRETVRRNTAPGSKRCAGVCDSYRLSPEVAGDNNQIHDV